MKMPLIFRILLLLVLAWRLLISNKKAKKIEPINYKYLDKSTSQKINTETGEIISDIEKIKHIYRAIVRNSNIYTVENQIITIAYQLIKSKRGIFNFFWYQNQNVIILYQIFKLLDNKILTEKYYEILSTIHVSAAKVIDLENITDDAFVILGDQNLEKFKAFDDVFNIDKFATQVINYVKS